jgi:hypothetical protein
MAGERLRLVGVGAVAAIVGELPRVPSPTPANLRRYDAVLRALSSRRPAVLPARFATCFDRPDELRLVLESRQASLRRSVARVRHRAQMTLRIVGAGGEPAGASGGRALWGSTGELDRVRPGTSGAAYLRGRAEAAARQLEIPGFRPVRSAVRRWVRGERVESRAGVASVYHLVPRSSVAAYRRAVERAAAAQGLHVVVSGPWPPYAFAGEW